MTNAHSGCHSWRIYSSQRLYASSIFLDRFSVTVLRDIEDLGLQVLKNRPSVQLLIGSVGGNLSVDLVCIRCIGIN